MEDAPTVSSSSSSGRPVARVDWSSQRGRGWSSRRRRMTAPGRASSDGERPAVGLGGELPGSPEWMELAATASSRAGLSKRQRRTGREASGASMEAIVQTGWAGQRPGGMGGAAGSGCGDCRCFDLALRNEDGGADDVVCWAGGKLAGTAGGREPKALEQSRPARARELNKPRAPAAVTLDASSKIGRLLRCFLGETDGSIFRCG